MTSRHGRRAISEAWTNRFPLDEAAANLVVEIGENGPGVRIDNNIRIAIHKIRGAAGKVQILIQCPRARKIRREEELADRDGCPD